MHVIGRAAGRAAMLARIGIHERAGWDRNQGTMLAPVAERDQAFNVNG